MATLKEADTKHASCLFRVQISLWEEKVGGVNNPRAVLTARFVSRNPDAASNKRSHDLSMEGGGGTLFTFLGIGWWRVGGGGRGSGRMLCDHY